MNPFDDAMREVLSQSRYDRLTGRALDLKQIVSDALMRILEFILKRLRFNLPDMGGFRTDIYVYVFIAVGVLLLVVITGITLRLLARRRKAAVHDLSDLFEELAQKQYTVDELLRLSQAREKVENLREAVRFRYIAVLVGLNERQVIFIEKSKTNAVLLAELNAAEPALAPVFSDVVDTFHHAWFGYKPVAAERYTEFLKNTDDLLRAPARTEITHAK